MQGAEDLLQSQRLGNVENSFMWRMICKFFGRNENGFVNENWNGTGDIVVYSNYHKYWLDKNSLYACREILLEHGAGEVEMFALGRAI